MTATAAFSLSWALKAASTLLFLVQYKYKNQIPGHHQQVSCALISCFRKYGQASRVEAAAPLKYVQSNTYKLSTNKKSTKVQIKESGPISRMKLAN